MDSKKIKSLLEELFTCPICLDILKDPATTKCGHSFCLECINKNNNECAVCRTKLDANFNINYLVKNAIESLGNMSEEELENKYSRTDTSGVSEVKNKKNDERLLQTEQKPKRIYLTTGYSNSNRENCLAKSENVNKYRVKRLLSQIDCFNEIDSDFMKNFNRHERINNGHLNFVNNDGQNIECNRDLFNNVNKLSANNNPVDFKFLYPENVQSVNKLTSRIIDNFLDDVLVNFQTGGNRGVNEKVPANNLYQIGGCNINFFNNQNIPTPIQNQAENVNITYNEQPDYDMNIINLENSETNKLSLSFYEVSGKRFKYK